MEDNNLQPILGKNICTIMSTQYLTDADKVLLINSVIVHWYNYADNIEDGIPKHLLVTWQMIEQEQESIKAKTKATMDKRKAGAAARWNYANKCKQMQADASTSEHLPTMPKIKEKESKSKIKEKISSEEKIKNKKEVSSDSSVDFSLTSQGYKYQEYAGLKLFADPVEHALYVTGEADTPKARRCYGAYLRDLGEERYLEELSTFEAECKAGEEPNNRGSALNSRLKSLKKH